MKNKEDKIAIIGMSCRFPGANTIEEFWSLLKNGENAISRFTPTQLAEAGVIPEISMLPNYKPYRGIIEPFPTTSFERFSIPAEEFDLLPIQTKVMLQLTARAFEHAKINLSECTKNVAVIMGVNSQLASTFTEKAYQHAMNAEKVKQRYYSRTLAPYVAYRFGFQGAAVDLYTACSSSATAIIQGCRELMLRQADLAAVGGVSIEFPQEFGYIYEENGIFSEDGYCRPFDANASGALFSNGAGLLLLKRLEDALASGDSIVGVIAGYAINNDGRLKAGFLAPGITGQYNCIKQAWESANILPNEIDYIEAHGAATQVGDPIEIFALKKVFQHYSPIISQCAVGSVKSNIGHTTAASGVAAVIKSALMLQHRAIVPSINFETLNPNIDLTGSPLHIANAYCQYENKDKLYTIGISNFGFGGTNTHMVLKEAQNYV